jgi:hypothetical protein
MTDGVVSAEAVSAYFAENLDETWAEIVATATTDCITAVESNVIIFYGIKQLRLLPPQL